MNGFKTLVNIKILVLAFFSVLFIWIGYFLYKHIENTHGFILGDWLVNYHDGGFKRRGLSGSIFFFLQDISGVKLKTLVYTTQMLLYFIFFFLIGKLLYNKFISLLFFSLILSPLTFLFFFNDVNIIGRKEILVYTIFTYFIYLKKRNSFNGYKEYSIYILLFTATLLHEIFIFYVPYFLIALFILDGKVDFKRYALIFLSVFIPTFFVFFFGGLINEGESIIMLSQRGVYFPENKLNIFDFSNTLLSSLDRYKASPISYSLYALSLLLGLLHFFYYLKKELKSDFRIITKYFLLAIIYSLPLFVLVCDWGRWLQIHFILLFIILLAKRPNIEEKPDNITTFLLNKKNALVLVFLIPFFFTWRIYHFKWGFSLDGMLYFLIKKVLVLV